MNAELWPHFQGAPEEICASVFAWAMARFMYVPDSIKRGAPEHWPSPAEIEADIQAQGYLQDDCDGFAAMCRHALRVNGVRSRLVLCWVEPAAGSGYHAVCEADGLVLDNRQLTICKTQDLERIGYVWDRMSGFNDNEDWTDVKRGEGHG